jgi:hypothetical protein
MISIRLFQKVVGSFRLQKASFGWLKAVVGLVQTEL